MKATRDWHRRAIVRFLHDVAVASPEGGRHDYRKGQEVEMIQWGNAGQEVSTAPGWWSSFDIDGAYIVKPDKVEIVRVISEVEP